MDISINSRKRLLAQGRVYVDQLSTEIDGNNVKMLVLSIGSGVGVVPISEDGKFLMVKEYRVGAAELQWNWPAGGIEMGESVEDCVRRELLEETGYEAGDLHYLGHFNSAPSYLEGYLKYYYSSDIKKVALPRDESLLEDFGLFTREEVLSMIASGEIKHTGTIAAFFLTLHQLAGNAN